MKAYNDWVTGKKGKNVTNVVCNKFYEFDPCFSVSILRYFKNAVVNLLVHTKSFTGSISECDVIYGYITCIGNAPYSLHYNL